MVRSRAGLGSGLRIIMDTWRTQSCRNFNLSQLLSAALSELNCLQLVIQSPLSSWSRFELLGISGLIEVEIPSTEFKDSEKKPVSKSHPLQKSHNPSDRPKLIARLRMFCPPIPAAAAVTLNWFSHRSFPDSEEVHATTKRRSDDLMQFFPVRFSFRHFGKGAIFPGASPIEWGDLSLYSECGKEEEEKKNKSWQPKGRHDSGVIALN